MKKVYEDYIFLVRTVLEGGRADDFSGDFEKLLELGVLDVCEKLKAEGRIKYLGFSFHDNYEAFERIITYRDWDFCQIQYNYMDTDEQAGDRGYELAKRLGV